MRKENWKIEEKKTQQMQIRENKERCEHFISIIRSNANTEHIKILSERAPVCVCVCENKKNRRGKVRELAQTTDMDVK